MGKFFDAIQPGHQEFIKEQKMFFVSTAPLSSKGHVNLSPKGLDSFRVLSPSRVAYLDIIGSGNETSAHILENGRITFMFCSFDGRPNILRLYGNGFTVLPGDPSWPQISGSFNLGDSTRQIIVADIHRVQTSCGFGVPLYQYVGERNYVSDFVESKGPEGLRAYMEEKNLSSVDGLPTALAQRRRTKPTVPDEAPGSLLQ